jgi:hypothetical protein
MVVQPRTRVLVRWVLLAGLAILGLIIIAAALTTSIPVRNDGTEPLRLSGCSIDGALDLFPDAAGSVDVIGGGKEGCSVYNGDSYRYIGCLTLPAPHVGQVLIRQSLNLKISEWACEGIY